MINLKKIADKFTLPYFTICEVGVFSSKESHVKELIPHAEQVILIEANPTYCQEINKGFKNHKHVQIYNYAVYYKNKKSIKLYNRDAATFIEGLDAPNVVNKKYVPNEKDAFWVEAKTFDFFDPGNIDILSMDIEGAEWFVLQNIISKPNLICLETHSRKYNWQTYVNPYINEIKNWMQENGYTDYQQDESDTIYLKN